MIIHDWLKDLINECDEAFLKEMYANLHKYILIYGIDPNKITYDLLYEKISDSMDKIRIYNKMNDFSQLYNHYFVTLIQLVEPYFLENGRSYKFYLRAKEISDLPSFTFDQLLDFTRIILCLYKYIPYLKENQKLLDNPFFIDFFDENTLNYLLDKMIPNLDMDIIDDDYLYSKNHFICIYIILIYYYLKSQNVVDTEDIK